MHFKCAKIHYQCHFGSETASLLWPSSAPWMAALTLFAASRWGRLIVWNLEHLCWEEERFLALACFLRPPQTSSINNLVSLSALFVKNHFFISQRGCPPNKHVSPCSTSRTNQHQTAAGLLAVDKQTLTIKEPEWCYWLTRDFIIAKTINNATPLIQRLKWVGEK